MKRLIPTLLLLSGCSSAPEPPVVFPALPPLPAAITSPCPPAALLSASSLGTLVIADIELAVAYAECAAKHASAVSAYNSAKAMLDAKNR